MLAAWYLHERPLPPDWRAMLILAVIIFLPAGLVAMEPDLGTAALIAASGALLVLMAGLSLRVVFLLLLLIAILAFILGIGLPTVSVYILTGLIAALAAWAALGRIPNADPNAYQNANLETITAVVIGGTSLFGGRGKAMHGVLGGLVIAAIDNGMGLQGYSAAAKYVVTALVLIAAVTIDAVARRGRTIG